MVSLQKYQNKKIAIYGMGLSGYSAAKILKKSKAKLFCWDDSAKVRKRIKKLNFKTKKFWLSLRKNSIDNILISPGIDINKCKIKHYLKKNKNKIITDIDLFFEINKKAFIISVTGTNGKSTTCKIIEKILKTAGYVTKVGGNIGKPVLSLKSTNSRTIFILELSSYQLQYSKLFHTNHAAILNISSDHLERHKNIANYIKAKSKIFFYQTKNDFTYINSRNKYSKKISNILKKKKIKSKLYKVDNYKYSFLLKKIKNKYFQSKNNIENLAFAYNITKNLKVSDKNIIKALNNFKGLPHRQEIIYSNKKITCINDSKATSFNSAFYSLSNYYKIFWIVGGLPKHKDKFNIKNLSNRIIKAYIIGKNTRFFEDRIKKIIPYKVSHNIKNAVNNILKDLNKNKIKKCTILFSPAAASFDQFKNFEDRGLYFKNIIIKKFKN